MATYIYAVGEKVTLGPASSTFRSRAAGACTVTARMPPLGDALQYRVKCEGEPFERVVLEHELSVQLAGAAQVAAGT
jgi:hypothetical protein